MADARAAWAAQWASLVGKLISELGTTRALDALAASFNMWGAKDLTELFGLLNSARTFTGPQAHENIRTLLVALHEFREHCPSLIKLREAFELQFKVRMGVEKQLSASVLIILDGVLPDQLWQSDLVRVEDKPNLRRLKRPPPMEDVLVHHLETTLEFKALYRQLQREGLLRCPGFLLHVGRCCARASAKHCHGSGPAVPRIIADPDDPAEERLAADELLIDAVRDACREAEVDEFAVLSEWTSCRLGPPPDFSHCWDRSSATVLSTTARHPSNHLAVILPPPEGPPPHPPTLLQRASTGSLEYLGQMLSEVAHSMRTVAWALQFKGVLTIVPQRLLEQLPSWLGQGIAHRIQHAVIYRSGVWMVMRTPYYVLRSVSERLRLGVLEAAALGVSDCTAVEAVLLGPRDLDGKAPVCTVVLEVR